MLSIELTENFRSNAAIVRLYSETSERMLFAKQRAIEMFSGYHFHSTAINQELLTVGFQNYFQFLSGKLGFINISAIIANVRGKYLLSEYKVTKPQLTDEDKSNQAP